MLGTFDFRLGFFQRTRTTLRKVGVVGSLSVEPVASPTVCSVSKAFFAPEEFCRDPVIHLPQLLRFSAEHIHSDSLQGWGSAFTIFVPFFTVFCTVSFCNCMSKPIGITRDLR